MFDSSRRTGPALEAHFQFIQWLVPTVERFPRRQKFLLGDRIQSAALDVLDELEMGVRSAGRDDDGLFHRCPDHHETGEL